MGSGTKMESVSQRRCNPLGNSGHFIGCVGGRRLYGRLESSVPGLLVAGPPISNKRKT